MVVRFVNRKYQTQKYFIWVSKMGKIGYKLSIGSWEIRFYLKKVW